MVKYLLLYICICHIVFVSCSSNRFISILDLYLYVFLFILHFIPGSLHVIDTRTLTPHRVGAGGVKVRECRGPAKVGEEYGDKYEFLDVEV